MYKGWAHVCSIRRVFALCTFGCGVYLTGFTWINDYDTSTCHICPRRVLCATTPFELVMLSVSRFTAGISIPSMIIAMLSKANNARTVVQHSSIGSSVDFEPTHKLHILYGNVFLWASVVHSLAHIWRFLAQDGGRILLDNGITRSGIVAVVLLLVSVLPMSLPWLRQKITYEVRKGFHYLAVVALISICFHNFALSIVVVVILVVFAGDFAYFYLYGTHLIENPTYQAVGGGTCITVKLPNRYSFKAGSYAYVMCPSISSREWHAFSIIPAAGDVEENSTTAGQDNVTHGNATFYVAAVGDWTKEVLSRTLQNTRMPLWISNALPSSMEHALDFDNVLLIATGVGITPCIR
ncbi:unnamed protein product [Choristocarpus tenellus]